MKILMINSVCGIRSTGKICTDLATLLENEGHECKIAYGREYVPENYRRWAVPIGNKKDVYIHAIHSRLLDNTGFGSKRATLKFIQWIKEYNPDIIHLHNIHGYYINVELLFDFLKYYNKPVIWTLHDCWAFTGHCVHFDLIGCDKWKDKCYKCPQKNAYPKSFFKDASFENFTRKKKAFTDVKNMHIVVPSRWLKEKVEASFLGNYPIAVIPSGIDIDIFKPCETNIREKYKLDDKKVILGVATAWEESKGLNDFIELSKRVNHDYHVVLVGLDNKNVPVNTSNITAIPRTDNMNELASLYSEAYVFMNLSSQETQGLTTIEALACGTPVIVYNRTASPEFVDEKVGFCVEYRNYEAIVECLRKVHLLTTEDCRRRSEEYEKNKCFEKYITLYKSIFKLPPF